MRVYDFKGLGAIGVPFCKRTLKTMEARGEWPRSFYLSPDMRSGRVWAADEIDRRIEELAAARDTEGQDEATEREVVTAE